MADTSARVFCGSYATLTATHIEDEGALKDEMSQAVITGYRPEKSVSCRSEESQQPSHPLAKRVLPFAMLSEPEGELADQFRVRPVNPRRVKQLANKLSNCKELLSELTVLDLNGQMVILDGNHRYQAMKVIRAARGEDFFPVVSCVVYEEGAIAEALAIGYNKNIEGEDLLKMSDWDKVSVIKRLLHQTPSDINAVFKALNATDVSKITL